MFKRSTDSTSTTIIIAVMGTLKVEDFHKFRGLSITHGSFLYKSLGITYSGKLSLVQIFVYLAKKPTEYM